MDMGSSCHFLNIFMYIYTYNNNYIYIDHSSYNSTGPVSHVCCPFESNKDVANMVTTHLDMMIN